MPILELRNIHKRFASTVALDGVDLEIQDGEVVAVVGENGAGKSTLMNIIAGAYSADQGRIAFSGGHIAYIRQELALFPHLSVADNILVGRESARFGFIQRREMVSRAAALLEGFGRSEIDPSSQVRDLSAANRQVVEICRALSSNARLILMDEPTSSLQRSDVDTLFSIIRKLCARGIAVLYVSHFLEEVREIAQRAVVLRDGRTVWSGALSSITDESLIAQMVGRSVKPRFASSDSARPGDVVLQVETAGASFTLRRGEILGIAGLVGSGRTELLRSLFGLDPPSSGTMRVRGEATSLKELTPKQSIRLGLGYLGEDRHDDGLIPHFSVRANITITRPEDEDVSSWISKLKIRTSTPLSSIRSLSGGNQQKTLLARLMHQGAEILLLDEPTRGIDVGSKADIYEQIRQMSREGKAIVVVSSYLPELFGLCDRLAVMSRGRLSAARPIHDWTPDAVLQMAIGGVE